MVPLDDSGANGPMIGTRVAEFRYGKSLNTSWPSKNKCLFRRAARGHSTDYLKIETDLRESDSIQSRSYLWRSKCSGMEVSDAKRLKALEAENARLKKLLA